LSSVAKMRRIYYTLILILLGSVPSRYPFRI